MPWGLAGTRNQERRKVPESIPAAFAHGSVPTIADSCERQTTDLKPAVDQILSRAHQGGLVGGQCRIYLTVNFAVAVKNVAGLSLAPVLPSNFTHLLLDP